MLAGMAEGVKSVLEACHRVCCEMNCVPCPVP